MDVVFPRCRERFPTLRSAVIAAPGLTCDRAAYLPVGVFVNRPQGAILGLDVLDLRVQSGAACCIVINMLYCIMLHCIINQGSIRTSRGSEMGSI